MKLCRGCGTEKSIDEFSWLNKSKGYLQSRCKQCAIKKSKEWREANPERARESCRKYHATRKTSDPQWLVDERMRKAKWKKDNPELVKAQAREYRERSAEKRKAARDANKDELNAKQRAYYAKNKEKFMRSVLARRLRLEQASPAWGQEGISEVYMFAEECRAFGLDVEVDHIVPLRGENVSGLHVLGNLRVALKAHNRSKGNRLLEEVP